MKKFQKTKEDFTCKKCNQIVEGDGYTNHCPKCLWSKHVDINPGDRSSHCGGMMEPVDIENKSDIFYVVHRCQKCNFSKKNKLKKGDSFDTAVSLLNKKYQNS